MIVDAFIDIVAVERLHDRLGVRTGSALDPVFKPLAEWSPATDDALTLRYIFRHLQPQRHVEFGAADGVSAALCLEECQATVWRTGPRQDAPGRLDAGDVADGHRHQFGHREWQRVGDSADVDRMFPPGFFDSALIHSSPTVDLMLTDTRTALSLVRSGGLIIWRDFCPDPALFETFGSVEATVRGVLGSWKEMSASLADAFWIRPSFLLAGIRR